MAANLGCRRTRGPLECLFTVSGQRVEGIAEVGRSGSGDRGQRPGVEGSYDPVMLPPPGSSDDRYDARSGQGESPASRHRAPHPPQFGDTDERTRSGAGSMGGGGRTGSTVRLALGTRAFLEGAVAVRRHGPGWCEGGADDPLGSRLTAGAYRDAAVDVPRGRAGATGDNEHPVGRSADQHHGDSTQRSHLIRRSVRRPSGRWCIPLLR